VGKLQTSHTYNGGNSKQNLPVVCTWTGVCRFRSTVLL